LAIGVELGIVIGVAVDIAFLLYFNARPGVQVERFQVGAKPTSHNKIFRAIISRA
jgi:hypothetical protein